MVSIDVVAGERALAEGDWAAARDAFAAGLDAEPAVAHDGMGRALWWLGDADAAIEHREQAYVAFKAAGERRRAALAAIWLGREHRAVYGNEAAENGWLARAERLLADDGDSPEAGRLWLAKARRAVDPAVRRDLADAAFTIATRTGDPDLEVAALAELGLARIDAGDLAEGLDRLDEAMAAATGGEADLPETIAEACCTLVAACERAGDAGRLSQWARIVDGLLSRRADLPSLAFCRTCNAEVLASTGRRDEAEAELLASTRDLAAAGHRSRCVDPAVKLAEVRIRQGRLEEAAALLEGREGLPESALPLADLYLARDEASLAVAVLLRRANRLGEDPLRTAPVTARLVDAQVANADLRGAVASAATLDDVARDTGHPAMVAYASVAGAAVATAQGHDPVGRLEIAVDRFDKLGMPVDAARARLGLAEALAERAPDVAVLEAQRAARAFEDADERRGADRTAALIRKLGGPARTGPKGAGVLTVRESEVLSLLAEGRTNAEIAERLFISTKTAGHHVSSILAKLGLRNRAEAAAFAIRDQR